MPPPCVRRGCTLDFILQSKGRECVNCKTLKRLLLFIYVCIVAAQATSKKKKSTRLLTLIVPASFCLHLHDTECLICVSSLPQNQSDLISMKKQQQQETLQVFIFSQCEGERSGFSALSALSMCRILKPDEKTPFHFLLLPPFSAFSLFSSEFLLLSVPLYLVACATFLTFGGEGENRELRIPPPLSATVSRLPACLRHLFALLSFCCFCGEEGCQVRQSSEEKLFCQVDKTVAVSSGEMLLIGSHDWLFIA